MGRHDDLVSIQQARDLLAQAAKAQERLRELDQAAVDRICEAIAQEAASQAESLARLAVDETGYGKVDSKTQKNLFATRFAWGQLRSEKTVGVIEAQAERGLVEIAEPFGIVAAVIPVTNPTSTALFKCLIAMKARCAIVVSPHPRAVRCISKSCEVAAAAAIRAGAPDGCITWITEPTLAATRELLRHKLTRVILATGGAGLVEAAYSSGKPAYGVGPGNVPCIVDRTADLAKAAQAIATSQSFDWGTICCSEQSIVTEKSLWPKLLSELQSRGAHLCSDVETRQLEKIAGRGGIMNPEIVGHSPRAIAAKAGFEVPEATQVLLAFQAGVGPEFQLSMEILAPILSVYLETDRDAVLRRAAEVLRYGGEGHTVVVHAQCDKTLETIAQKLPAFRILVNAPSTQGSIGLSTNLVPSLSLGCGSYGSNISSDNISARHLIQRKRMAWVQAGWESRLGGEASSRPGVLPAGEPPKAAPPKPKESAPVAPAKAAPVQGLTADMVESILAASPMGKSPVASGSNRGMSADAVEKILREGLKK